MQLMPWRIPVVSKTLTIASTTGESRDLVIGMSSGGILFVVATYRDEDTRRIISARKATKHEKDRYYAGDREIW